MKLGLGTAQFGLPYGIANTSGQVAPDQVRAILRVAHARGVRVLDTAISYGTSEAVLGAALRKDPRTAFRVVSKIPNGTRARDIHHLVRASLARLSVARAHGFLLHDAEIYRKEPDTLAALWEAQSQGLVDKVGFSVYEPSTVDGLLRDRVRFDIVQFPYNVFDRRFEPLFERLKEYGVEVHVRSVFLQGLFFLDPARLPTFFAPVRDALVALRALAAGASLPLAALPLALVLDHPCIDVAIVGVDSLGNLEESLDITSRLDAIAPLLPRLAELEQHDEDILLPTRWQS